MPRIVFKELDSGQTYTVSDSDALIGRDPACAFVVDGSKSQVVSGRHARIYVQEGSWWIEDMSRNGTVVDHERLQRGVRHVLREGQVLGLGDTGPRYAIMEAETRSVTQTVVEGSPPAPDRRMPTPPRPTEPVLAMPESPVAGPTKPRAAPVRAGAQLAAEPSTEPIAPSPDWIVHMVLRANTDNRRYDVRGDLIKIGRGPVCVVQIPADQGASVSRVHTEVAILEGGVIVRDAGSRNGTFLNGKRLDAPQQCSKGDQITLGAAGPTLVVEELHIVKPESLPPEAPRETPIEFNKSTPPGGVRASAAAQPGAVKRALAPAANLARRSLGKARKSASNDAGAGASTPSRRGGGAILWSSVLGVVAIVVLFIGMMQSRAAHASRARVDSMQRAAAAEETRLRISVDSARAANAPAAVLDSLSNALADATRRSKR